MFKIFFVGNLKSLLASNNKDLLKKNQQLLNIYNGKRIFIFFTGTSIRDVNFSDFKNEHVMGVNFLALHHKFKDLDADFYCFTPNWDASWSKLMAWGLAEIYEGLNSKAKLFLSASSHYWINNFDYFGILDGNKKFKNNTYFISNKAFILNGGSNVNCNVPKSMHGVLSRSIGIAIDMGFKDIYLVGADYSKDPLRVGHFYGSTDFITSRSEEEVIINNQIMKFAKEKNVKIINVIDEGFTSPIYEGISQSKLAKILQKQS